jgi:hypothetical protein
MLRLREAVVFLTGSILLGVVGQAADRAVHLQVPPPVRKNVAGMPQIIAPADAAESQINAAVQRLDATVGKAVDACKGPDGKPGYWERAIDVPMRGPGYISYVITDNLFCGGAHPDAATMSIVYDLRSGAPIDWTRLLPPSLTGTVALEQGADGTRMVTLASKRLFALYLDGYHASSAESQAECRHAIQDVAADGARAAMVWLDARTGGLAVQVGLPHVVQACEAEVVIPVATLRAEGAQPALVDAIQAALQK